MCRIQPAKVGLFLSLPRASHCLIVCPVLEKNHLEPQSPRAGFSPHAVPPPRRHQALWEHPRPPVNKCESPQAPLPPASPSARAVESAVQGAEVLTVALPGCRAEMLRFVERTSGSCAARKLPWERLAVQQRPPKDRDVEIGGDGGSRWNIDQYWLQAGKDSPVTCSWLYPAVPPSLLISVRRCHPTTDPKRQR